MPAVVYVAFWDAHGRSWLRFRLGFAAEWGQEPEADDDRVSMLGVGLLDGSPFQ